MANPESDSNETRCERVRAMVLPHGSMAAAVAAVVAGAASRGCQHPPSLYRLCPLHQPQHQHQHRHRHRHRHLRLPRRHRSSPETNGGRFKRTCVLLAVLRIRIRRIHMFLALPDLDPLVRNPDPVPGSVSFYHQAKKSKNNIDPFFCVKVP
jgi:hypothetical protein